MNIEVITVGDEILSGNTVDTNFAWIGGELWMKGYDLVWHSTVADNPDRIGETLLAAVGRSGVAIVTGGLGPTTDDITLESAARAFGLPLKLDERALAEIRGFFKRVGREMSLNNEKQAMLPEGSRMISNRVGTAPGCHLTFKGTEFFFLPGVPKEMRQQFEDAVLPFLGKKNPGAVLFSKIFRCFGLPEATLDQEVRSLNLGEARLGWQVVFPEVLVKISSSDPKKGKEVLSRAEGLIREKIGSHIYAEGDETIERLVGRLLGERGETLSVAESCTGGLIQNLLTNVPGSSGYFRGGVVSYSDDLKAEFLKIDPRLIKSKGAVSSEVAIAMAEGVRQVAKSTYGVGVTGIAGPLKGLASPPPPRLGNGGDGASPSTAHRAWLMLPVGTVHIAIAGPKGTEEKKYFFPHDREWFKLLAAHTALHALKKIIVD